ncbi:GNAT family N-acetyltransferase [Xenorhabdus eapokensis]|uniref:GCN5 family acetyltransferase n=1 Tax=Xenorhabdus eapokensis TaxID=1873482 RepID=A0A1Q5TLU9_9GAMM|nr:GCN5 family acetyltransferase [Xenorhabdus eapokensis]
MAPCLPFSPFVEIGWRLDKPFWGQGYTCEAAHRIFDCAFTEIGLEEIVAFTTVSNYRSERVMKKLDMVRDEKTFLHPGLEADHPLREHVLYRLKRSDFV